MGEKKLTSYDIMMRTVFPERTCPVCGKKIVRPCFAEYAYKIGRHVFCSWTCMRKFEKERKVKFDDSVKKKRNTPLLDGGKRK